MQLNEIQKSFRDLLTAPLSALDRPPEDFAGLFQSGSIALRDRLHVYRGNVMIGLSEKLAVSFPLMEKLVGRDFLLAMARDYISGTLPSGGDMTEYGLDFDAFVRTYEPAAALPYLSDMARFEILWSQAYHAIDDLALDAHMLATAPEDSLADMILQPRASTALFRSAYPIDRIYALCQENPGEGEDETLDLSSGETTILIHRADLNVQFEALPESEFFMLETLFENNTLGDSIEKSIHRFPDFDIGIFLPKFLNRKIFASPLSFR